MTDQSQDDLQAQLNAARAEVEALKAELVEAREQRDYLARTANAANKIAADLRGIKDRALAKAEAAEARATQAEQDKLELMRAFGAISLAVAAIDKGSDNTPWQDIVARVEKIGACWDEGLRQSVGEAHLRQQAEKALASRDVELAASYEVRNGHVAVIERLREMLTTKEQALADCQRAAGQASRNAQIQINELDDALTTLRAEHAALQQAHAGLREALADIAERSMFSSKERIVDHARQALALPPQATRPPEAPVCECGHPTYMHFGGACQVFRCGCSEAPKGGPR